MISDEFQNMEPLQKFSNDYHNNEELRSRIDNGDLAPMMQALNWGYLPRDADVRVFCNTADTFYLTLPSDPNVSLRDQDLESVSGGSTTGCASTVFCAGTVPSCVSSGSSVGTASSRAVENGQYTS